MRSEGLHEAVSERPPSGKPIPGVTNLGDTEWQLTKARRFIFAGGDPADVADFIQGLQRFHHHFTDNRRLKFGFAHAFELTDDAGHHPFEPLRVDRSFAQGHGYGADEFLAFERRAAARSLQNHQFTQLHALEGGEPAAAFGTGTPTPDRSSASAAA